VVSYVAVKAGRTVSTDDGESKKGAHEQQQDGQLHACREMLWLWRGMWGVKTRELVK
jgi:hypothetical protein